MSEDRIRDLLEQYQKGICSTEEKRLLEYIYNFSESTEIDKVESRIKDEIWEKLTHVPLKLVHRKQKKQKIFYAAASLIVIMGLGVIYANYLQGAHEIDHKARLVQDLILPGSVGATLTLSDGKKIKLSSDSNQERYTQAGVVITKKEDGVLVYSVVPGMNKEMAINTLSTSSGESYQVKLPDGSLVWLNARSSLQYPTSFSGKTNRKVELMGEAYFEVAKDKKHPFQVISNKQLVTVLGTHFNIKCYPEDKLITTTLLEGSVQVNSQKTAKIITPGNQTILSADDQLVVVPADVEAITAWRNNEFMFQSEDIESVMKNISRWYNVEVVYTGSKPTERYSGGLSRFDQVTKVLRMLETTGGVHFKIDGRKIYVSK